MISEVRRTVAYGLQHPIAKRAKLTFFTRFFTWQLGSRILRHPVQLPWIEGSSLMTERGMTGATGNWYYGLHEFYDMALLLHFFGDKNSSGGFLDVGANIGSYTILASAVCGQRSISFEPVPATHSRLERNLRMNKIEPLVEARCAAAGRESGNIRFTVDRDTKNQVVGDDYTGRIIMVPVISLDECFSDIEKIPAFWKVDVEGHEEEVLAGASRVLSSPAVEVVLLEADSLSVESIMHGYGFRRATYDVFNREVLIHEGHKIGNNHLWIRDEEMVQRRCRASRRFSIFGVQF